MYSQLEQIALSDFGGVVIRTQMVGRRAGVALKLRLHTALREFLTFIQGKLAEYGV